MTKGGARQAAHRTGGARCSSNLLEMSHVRSAMSAQQNKTDAADALGLTHMARTARFKAAFIKSKPYSRMRLLLTQRSNLKLKSLDIENSIRHWLKAFGIHFKNTGCGGFRGGSARSNCRRPADERADGSDAHRARSPMETMKSAARFGGEDRRPRTELYQVSLITTDRPILLFRWTLSSRAYR
jgi:hypothetical protein